MLQFQAMIHGNGGDGRPAPLSVTFEKAMATLAALPRMFIEPDGSFVWAQQEPDGKAWQLDGSLIDQGVTLSHVELGGRCPEAAFEQVLAALDWPASKLLFQLPRQGKYCNETDFRLLAGSSGGAA